MSRDFGEALDCAGYKFIGSSARTISLSLDRDSVSPYAYRKDGRREEVQEH